MNRVKVAVASAGIVAGVCIVYAMEQDKHERRAFEVCAMTSHSCELVVSHVSCLEGHTCGVGHDKSRPFLL